MDFWTKARSFAEEAAKRSQELTKAAAKRSQELTIGSSRISDIVSEASKKADEIKLEALKKADQLKILAEGISPQKIVIPSISLAVSADSSSTTPSAADLEKFGITDDLREFVKGITQNTFQDFPMKDNPETSDVSMVANVRRDLNEWQEKHANLVLSTVKEISKLRYQLCPRYMTDRKFWRIYFILVNTHVAPYEKLYMEELKLKSAGKGKAETMEQNPTLASHKSEVSVTDNQIKKSTSSAEQDLDVFLLGDLASSEEGPDDDNDGGSVGDFDDEFDEIVKGSDDEQIK
ncbi:hypothetical protein Scep_016838 [Stephania cephalantha]|uniref:BSD domain-containing protein n=1 Tax=Stephania cephalantha TaxID=152367 RepID=A0AAP0INY7_9MAGN